jgi:hypothetical protein
MSRFIKACRPAISLAEERTAFDGRVGRLLDSFSGSLRQHQARTRAADGSVRPEAP